MASPITQTKQSGGLKPFFYSLSGYLANPLVVLFVAGWVVHEHVLGMASQTVEYTIWFVAGYRWGHGWRPIDGLKRRTHWPEAWTLPERVVYVRGRLLNYFPFALAVIGVEWIFAGVGHIRDDGSYRWFEGQDLIWLGLIVASILMGRRARDHDFGGRDILRDLLYGPPRWIVPAMVADLSLYLDRFRATIPLAGIVLFSMAMIALTSDPLFTTRRGIIAWRMAERLRTAHVRQFAEAVTLSRPTL